MTIFKKVSRVFKKKTSIKIKPIKVLSCPKCGMALRLEDNDSGAGLYRCGECSKTFTRKLKV